MYLTVTTYNILSAPLANKDWYPTADPAILEKQYRWALFVARVFQWVRIPNHIICLQEVPREWRCNLEAMLRSLDYTSYAMTQGNIHNDFMNVMMLIPNHLTVLAIEYHQIQAALKPEDYASEEDWKMATRGWNWVIVVQLSSGVAIATTHLPCRWRDDNAMSRYASIVRQYLQKYDRLILTGDFNIHPQMPAYPILADGLTSAYPDVPYTVFTATKENPSGFKAAIDHILFRGMTLAKVNPIDTNGELLPNKHELSDHLMLSAVFIM